MEVETNKELLDNVFNGIFTIKIHDVQLNIPPKTDLDIIITIVDVKFNTSGTWRITKTLTQHSNSQTNVAQPVTNSAQPVTNAAQPVTNSAQLVTNSAQPVTNSVQPLPNTIPPVEAVLNCFGPITVGFKVVKRVLLKEKLLGECYAIVSSHSKFGNVRNENLILYGKGKQGKISFELSYVQDKTASPDAALTRSMRETLKFKIGSVKKKNLERLDSLKSKFRPICHTYHYDSIVPHLHTGDIILFHGIESHSTLIESSTLSYWSHAAIIIRNPSNHIKTLYGVDEWRKIAESAGYPYTDDPMEDVYLYESDYDTFTKQAGGGTQLIPFKSWILDYEREYKRMFLVVRRLVIPGRTYDDSVDFPNLEAWLQHSATKSYKISKRQLVGSVAKLNKTEDLSSIFCSELVAATLKAMGVLHNLKNCTNITPKDFSKAAYQNKLHILHLGKEDFELEKGAYLEEEVRIIFNKHKYSEKVLTGLTNSPQLQKRKID